MKTCANCGESLLGLDGRYKYCSDTCAREAHRRQSRENWRRHYQLNRDKEQARSRTRYALKKNNAHKAQEK